MLKTNLKTIKEVIKYRYSVTMARTPNDVYVITAKNLVTNKSDSVNIQDFNLASEIFIQKINNLEGN